MEARQLPLDFSSSVGRFEVACLNEEDSLQFCLFFVQKGFSIREPFLCFVVLHSRSTRAA